MSLLLTLYECEARKQRAGGGLVDDKSQSSDLGPCVHKIFGWNIPQKRDSSTPPEILNDFYNFLNLEYDTQKCQIIPGMSWLVGTSKCGVFAL